MHADPLIPQTPDFRRFATEIAELARFGMQSAVFARECPGGVALKSPLGVRNFAQLHANANRIASYLRQQGLRPGDAAALMCGNRAEFVEVLLAALRIGVRLTPINTHLTGDEAAHVIADCQARVLFVESGRSAQAQQLVPGVVIGEASWAAALAAGSPLDLVDPVGGSLMLYTSGTTGRPRGVLRSGADIVLPQFEGTFADYRPGDVQLCAGPAYHAAPLMFDLRWPLASGVPIVLVDRWDTASVLQALARDRVSHAHMVPTMFRRLLGHAVEARSSFDLSALRCVIHGAEPCPIPVKQAMIDWLGPVLIEYYAATEGGEQMYVTSQDWLSRPGTVGKLRPEFGHRLLDDEGRDVPPGDVGRVFFRAPASGRFEYFGDAGKTAASYQGDYFTLGDLGRVDADGWLFLVGRCAETIISGGVNIYPREIDDVLAAHPDVTEVCTVGAPDPEWGERVVAVVVPVQGRPAGDALAADLVSFARERLSHFKCPRDVVFRESLPYSATGKLLRSAVRSSFWHGHSSQI